MNKTVILGKNGVEAALENKRPIANIYLSEALKRSPLARNLQERRLNVQYLSASQMEKRFGPKHGGVAAEVMSYHYLDLSTVLERIKAEATLVILDGLEDPHNLGAVLRSAEATGMDAVIIPKHRSVQLNQTVAKVSCGAIEFVDVVQATNLVQTIKTLKNHNFWIIGVEANGETPYYEQDYRGRVALIIGSEGKGISRLVKEHCDYLVRIPMAGQINSLNASVSAALIFYEVFRNRKAVR